jgi:tetratricopeptide (TPR) repeat protein
VTRTMTVRTLAAAASILIVSASAHAQLGPAAQVGPRSAAEVQAADYITGSIEAVVAGDFNGALGLAQQAVAANSAEPWGYYVRGVALLALKRVDDAMGSFRDAELRFPESDAWGTSVAIWGQANALFEARPCRDAKAVYERYSQLVAPLDSAAAALGRAFANKQCPQPAPAPYSMLDPAWELYRRGDALLREQRYDEAVTSYREAESRLPESNAWGRSIAIWAQANAMVEAGRCAAASPIFVRYAQYVGARDADAAAMGLRYAQHRCVPIRR